MHIQQCYAIDATSSNEIGGPTALALALTLVDGIDVMLGVSPATITGDQRAIGLFTGGVTPVGTLLPLPNQNVEGDAEYSGGIGIESGVCLCTGWINDEEVNSPTGRGVGIQGPNNGDPITAITPGGPPVNEGEVSLDMSKPVDADFEAEVFSGAGSLGGDATVLEFEIETTAPGFLRISLVHASDEFPAWQTSEFNDTTTIFVDGVNIVLFKKQDDGQVVEGPLKLSDLHDCGSPFFKNNQIAPAPLDMFPTLHLITGVTTYYDHEYAGFSKVLTLETKCVLAPGTHTVKIVIQDVGDRVIDSGVFLESNSLKLFSFLAADFNLDGKVTVSDFTILSSNFGMTGAKFTDGDANGDGSVTITDLSILSGSFGQTGGNANFCADFNRDGNVAGADFQIWQQGSGLSQCASRAEGDADGDGDVDLDDLAIYEQETSSGIPSGLCGCEATQQAMAGGGGAFASGAGANESEVQNPNGHPADTDGDGDFDVDDLANWEEIYGAGE